MCWFSLKKSMNRCRIWLAVSGVSIWKLEVATVQSKWQESGKTLVQSEQMKTKKTLMCCQLKGNIRIIVSNS